MYPRAVEESTGHPVVSLFSPWVVGSKTPELEGLVAYAAIGQLRGYSAIVEFFPDVDLSYVLLSNVKDFPLLSENVASTYLQRER